MAKNAPPHLIRLSGLYKLLDVLEQDVMLQHTTPEQLIQRKAEVMSEILQREMTSDSPAAQGRGVDG